jgi:hypothetical protein
MRVCGLCFAAILVLGGLSSVRASGNSDTEPDTILARAVKALGGAERMGKLRAVKWKAKGTIFGPGVEIAVTEEGAALPPDRQRLQVTQEVGGNQLTQTQVLKGNRAWARTGQQVFDLPRPQALNQAGDALDRWLVSRPLLLKGRRDVTLSPLGEIKVGDQPAVGIRVSRAGRPDLNIFYDKKSGLPLKSETRVREKTGEVVYEFFYSDYREFEGFKHYTKLTWNKDGRRFAEKEWIEIKPVETLDDQLFDRP